ncbi:hypothetical protein FRB96_008750 [Tulasnella sp. 330]|nr:hypothetical protein FRB96_008750 [Tulasnella sp. 330]
MEDDEGLNAGLGSNLTFKGTVECDSAIMNGSGDFGAVGALSGVRNPISVARRILKRSTEPSAIGRVYPMMLVSAGAHAFAEKEGHAVAPPDEMICERAQKEWEYWRARMAEADSNVQVTQSDGLADTVGAVVLCWDGEGDQRRVDVAAGVSSGGILLKPSGRIGEAAIFGAGCWASRRVAVSVSGELYTTRSFDSAIRAGRPAEALGVWSFPIGTGEQIVRAALARTLGEAVERCYGAGADGLDTHEEIERAMTDFREACIARGDSEANAGAIVLVLEDEDEDKEQESGRRS